MQCADNFQQHRVQSWPNGNLGLTHYDVINNSTCKVGWVELWVGSPHEGGLPGLQPGQVLGLLRDPVCPTRCRRTRRSHGGRRPGTQNGLSKSNTDPG